MDKVLFIGGNDQFLSTLKAGLDKVGLFEVSVAKDDLQAVETLLEHAISVVVIDINTPSDDCLETIAYLTRAHPSIPLVLMTDYGKPWFQHKQGKKESLYHLPKPFEIGVLVSAIFVGFNIRDEGINSRGITVISLLPLIEAQRKTCRMEVRAKGRKGYLYFTEGKLMDAFCEGLDSEQAAREISRWDGIAISFSDLPGGRARNRVDTDLMDLVGAAWVEGYPGNREKADDDADDAFSLKASALKKDSPAETLRKHTANFREIRGFVGLIVNSGDGTVLAKESADDAIDLERLAKDLFAILPRLYGSLEKWKLGRMSALVFEATHGTVFVARSNDPAAGSYQVTTLATTDANRPAIQSHMQKLLALIVSTFG